MDKVVYGGRVENNREIKSVSGTVLGTFEIFKMLDIATRDEIALKLRMHQVDKGQFVISGQGADTDVYFLISGRIRVCTFALGGKQIHFEELRSGMMFGELSAIDGMSRSSDCISLDVCHLAVMSSDCFKAILSEHSQVQHAVLIRLAGMVRANMQKVYEFGALSVSQRVRCELLRLASEAKSDASEIVLNSVPTHAEIAARISTHREAVTREVKALETTGLITWRKNKYAIHDIAGLSELVMSDSA